MLKFVKHHMESIDGIEIFPLISLTIFFLFFAGMLVYVFKRKKKDWEAISNIPLENPNHIRHEEV